MTVNVTKPQINLREKLSEVDKPSGIAGEAILRSETPQEVFNYINAGRRNLIINGAMQVAQRGTSVTVAGTGAYSSPDRFRFQTNLNTDSVISQDSDVPSGQGFSYSFKLTVGTGATPSGSDFGRLYHRNEGYDSNQFNLGSSDSKAITLSFWVKSSVTGTYGVQFAGDGNGAYVASYIVNSSGTWEYKTITIPAGVWTTYNGSTTNGAGFQVAFDLGEGPSRSSNTGYDATVSAGNMGLTGGTKILATSGATFYLTGVQLEVGKVATPFEHRSYGEELALCQRYCFYTGHFDASSYEKIAIGTNTNTTQCFTTLFFPVTMRTQPTITTTGTASDYGLYHQGDIACSAVPTLNTNSTNNVGASTWTVASGLLAGGASVAQTNNAESYLIWDAEL